MTLRKRPARFFHKGVSEDGRASHTPKPVESWELSEWTVRAGAVVKDFPGEGRVVIERKRKVGTRNSFVYFAKLRPEGADAFGWHRIALPPDAAKSQRSAQAWLDAKYGRSNG